MCPEQGRVSCTAPIENASTSNLIQTSCQLEKTGHFSAVHIKTSHFSIYMSNNICGVNASVSRLGVYHTKRKKKIIRQIYQPPKKSQAGYLWNLRLRASQVCHPPLLRSRLHPPAERSARRHNWDAVVLLVEVPNIWHRDRSQVPGPSLRTSPLWIVWQGLHQSSRNKELSPFSVTLQQSNL